MGTLTFANTDSAENIGKIWQLVVHIGIAVGRAVAFHTCGQSYKQFMLIIYNSRVVIWGIFKSSTTLES